MRSRRDYHQKNLRNPFFPKASGASYKRRPIVFWGVLLILVITGFVWLNNGKSFQITNIEVKGTTIASQAEIEALVGEQSAKRRWLIFSQRSLFFFNTRKLENTLAQNFGPGHLAARKKYFKTIIISASQDISLVAWSTQQKTYYLDINGIALRQAGQIQTIVEPGKEGTEVIRSQTQFADQPLVFDTSDAEVNIGQEVTSPEIVKFIIDLTKLLKSKGDFDLAHYEIMSPYADQITLKTLSGWQVYFKTTDSVEQQVNRLITVLQQRVDDRNNLEYIDLRYGDKVFYK